MKPKTDSKREERERLERLVRSGEIKPGTGRILEAFWRLPAPEDPNGSVRRALIEDLRQGR